MTKRTLADLALAIVLVGVGAGVFLYLRTGATGPLPPEALAMPADTGLVMGVDVKRLVAGEFYKKLKVEAPDSANELRELERKTGLDLEKDVEQLVVGVGKTPGRREEAVVLAKGSFDRGRLAAFMEMRAVVTKRELPGYTVYDLSDDQSVAILDDHTAVFGTAGRVEAMVSGLARGDEPLRSNAAVLGLLERVRPGSTFWMVAGEGFVSRVQNNMPGGPIFPPPVKSLIFTGDLDPAVVVEMIADNLDQKRAEQSADEIRFYMGMVGQWAEAKARPELRELASALSVTTEGTRVLVKAQLSEKLADKVVLGPMRQALAARPSETGRFAAPIEVPEEIRPEEGIDLGVEGGVPGGVEGGVPGGVVGGVVGGLPEAPPPVQAVRVGGSIKEPKKLKHVNPVYPDIAKRARVQGIVIMEVTLSPQGKVTDAKVLRGIPLLDQAAIDAVKQWVYTPTLLNGVPVPVIMTVTVNFKLS